MSLMKQHPLLLVLPVTLDCGRVLVFLCVSVRICAPKVLNPQNIKCLLLWESDVYGCSTSSSINYE